VFGAIIFCFGLINSALVICFTTFDFLSFFSTFSIYLCGFYSVGAATASIILG
jgi:hypothetical protein